jgi:fibronectin type 3 domain-containing protein
MFQPKIPMPDTNGSLPVLFGRNGDEITKLSTPAQFYVAPYYSASEIRLTWSPVRGAMYYMVERAVAASGGGEPDSSEYELLERVYDGASYVDKILPNPALESPEFQNEYFYRVSAFNTAKKYEESEPTIPRSAMLFRAPASVKASGGTSIEVVELQWERSPGADAYEIWRSDFPNGASASLLDTVRGNQTWFNNRVTTTEQGKDFYYMITAKNSFGNKTPQTRPAYGYARVYGAPDAPANVRLAAGSGRGHSITKIEIEWKAVDEMDAYYAVYRYSETDSSLTRLTENTDQTSWTDTQGLRAGIYYYYKVQAITDDIASSRALKSQFSSPDPEGFLLSSPEEVIAEKSSDGNSVTVKWKPAKGNEGERLQYTYNVYAGHATEGNLSHNVAASVLPATGADGYISAEVDLSAGAFFRVSTVNGTVESAQSAVVSPSPAAAIIQDASQHAFITGEAANSNGVYPVRITWKKPADENPAFYNVQRSTRTGSGFTKINEARLEANGPFNAVYSYDPATEVYTYIDRNDAARVGRKYYYRVLSLNQLEQGSFPSDERLGWGALTHAQYMIEYNKTMNSALKKLTYMHKPGSTDKLGTETKNGSIGGTIYYNAAIAGLGARIIIQLSNYADFYIENELANGVYFTLTGNSNTSANMSSNGDMDGTVTCTGMYPGSVSYDRIEIKGGAAGGGTYGIQPAGFPRAEVPYTVVN